MADEPLPVFAYGTLMFAPVLRAVAGVAPTGLPAVLDGFARFRVAGRAYPGIVERVGVRTEGLLYEGLGARAVARLDAFEDAFYDRRRVLVRPGGDESPRWARAWVVPSARAHLLSKDLWDPATFGASALETFLLDPETEGDLR